MALPSELEARAIGVTDGLDWSRNAELALRSTPNTYVRHSTTTQIALEAAGWPHGAIAVYALSDLDMSGFTEVVLDTLQSAHDLQLDAGRHLARARYDWASDPVEGTTLAQAYSEGFVGGV